MSTDSDGPLPGLSTPPTLDFAVRIDAPAGTVVLRGELDGETSCLVGGVVDGRIAHGHVDLRVDVGDLAYVDLDGFDALREADRRLREHGGGLVLVRWSRIVECLATVSDAEHLLGRGRDAGRPPRSPGAAAGSGPAPAAPAEG